MLGGLKTHVEKQGWAAEIQPFELGNGAQELLHADGRQGAMGASRSARNTAREVF